MAAALQSNHAAPQGSTVCIPDEVSTVRGGYPTIDEKPMFRYAHSPSRWRVLAGRVVPALSKIPLTPGSQRVRREKDGKLQTDDHRVSLERMGLVLIPFKAGPGGSYLRQIEAKNSKAASPYKTYLSAWETASIGSAELEVDEEALASWLTSLVEDGIIDPPSPQVLAAKVKSVERRVRRAHSAPVSRGMILSSDRELEAELAVWEAALAAHKKQRVSSAVAHLDEDDLGDAPKAKAPKRG